MPMIIAFHRRSLGGAISGFTLIELMLVVAVVTVLSLIAFPAYTEYVIKARRAEAITLLNRIAQEQERWRANNPTYATLAATPASGVVMPNPASGYYTLNVASATATGYVATASASGAQAGDNKCTSLTLTLSGGNLTYDRTGTATVSQCWNR
jgi:type IV pilus assembly protein PilE